MKRFVNNPILSPRELPGAPPRLADVSSVFNPGAVRFNNGVTLLLRVQNRGRETFLLTAHGDDGFHFQVNPEPVVFRGLDRLPHLPYHIYDPRITPLADRFLITLALDTDAGCLTGLAETRDFETFRFLGLTGDEECRNAVLFPRTFDGAYLRLDRPNTLRRADAPPTGDTIRLSRSYDLLTWEPVGDLFKGRPRYWDELIGPGTPPLRTERGWLFLYHGVATHFGSSNIYQAGVALLDLDDPSKVIVRGRYNILEPRETYELTGQVPNVVFPTGWVAEDESDATALPESRVLIYYGAADTHVCLFLATVNELIEACYAGN
ncbi:MAG: glycoside hydrolase family 130 protein [Acidobacteriota bacterium]|nr:glycoside hydrolase family 130 protein [Acidobacteriota bacterium]